MEFQIRPFNNDDIDGIVELSLLAWAPVFVSWEKILGSRLYPIAIYPDWRQGHIEGVKKVCNNEKVTTYIAEVDGMVVGFIAYSLDDVSKKGEIQLLAVHPEYHNHGIGTTLNTFALQKLKEAGMKVAIVNTGGEESHAPARRSYEKAGYVGVPWVRYYKEL